MKYKKIICVLLTSVMTFSVFFSNISFINAKQSVISMENIVKCKESSSYGQGNNSEKAFDQNDATRWTSDISLTDANKNSQFIQAQFDQAYDINKVEITWFTPWVNGYEIQSSSDGDDWKTISKGSVSNQGIELSESGAEGLKQMLTVDKIDANAKYLKVVMNDVDITKGSYLSIVNVKAYTGKVDDNAISEVTATLNNIGSYGANTPDLMLDGIRASASNRWTSNSLTMTKDDVKNASIDLSLSEGKEVSKVMIDWFNTPVTKYSLLASTTGNDSDFVPVAKNLDVVGENITVGIDTVIRTTAYLPSDKVVKKLRLKFEDTSSDSGMFLSICEISLHKDQEPQNPWEINLVKDATAEASSVQSVGMEADKAIDNNLSTRWASEFNKKEQALTIDLQKDITFDQMKMYQEAAFAKSYNVEISSDNKTYTEIYKTSSGKVGQNNIYFGDLITGRYLKINFSEYGAYTAYSIFEVELFNNGAERMLELLNNELTVPTKISANFKLKNISDKNIKIDWSTTSKSLKIDKDGNVEVTSPKVDEDIVLKATAKYGNQSREYEFDVKLLSEENRVIDYQVYPVPQKKEIIEKNVTLDKNINVVLSSKVKDNDTLKSRIEEVLKDAAYSVVYSDEPKTNETNLLVGVNGDQGVADLYVDDNSISKDVFADSEEEKYDCHIVAVQPDKTIVVLAESSESAYYGFATLEQMFAEAQSNDYFGNESTRMTATVIEDYANMQYRGVIEGFYGWPWSLDDRLSYLEFAKKYKLNYYAYGPKSDPYHLTQWNKPYPTTATITEEERKLGVMTQEDIKILVESAKSNNVDFVWSIHPAMGDDKIDFNSQESIEAGKERILNKYNSMYELGVRQFGLFVDDIDLGVAYRNRVHITDLVDDIQKDIYASYGRFGDDTASLTSVKPLMFVPSHYFLTFGNPTENEAAIRELQRVHDDVIITFTGAGCWSNVNEADAKKFADMAGRNPMFWWNYSTNDIMDDQLFTDKADSYYAMNKNVKSLYGFVSNPMNEAELSKISLFGIADYAWNISEFDSSKNYDAFFETEYKDRELANAYKVVAKNLDKNGKSLENEKSVMNKIKTAFKDGEVSEKDKQDFKNYINELKLSLNKIKEMNSSSHLDQRNLYDEMKLWLNKLNAMVTMAEELINYLDNRDTYDIWQVYSKNASLLNDFKINDKYAFVSLELNVSNAQASYLRNIVAPNDPLKNFLSDMNTQLETLIVNEQDNNKEEVITNVPKYKELEIVNENYKNILKLDGIKLSKLDYLGLHTSAIMNNEVDIAKFIEQGLTVEYSDNGKQWHRVTESSVKTTYLRVINDSDKEIIIKDLLLSMYTPLPRSLISTNMNTYGNYTIDKAFDKNASTKFWKNGAQAENDEVVVSYDETAPITSITLNFDGDGTKLLDVPNQAVLEISSDTDNWQEVATINKNDIIIKDGKYYYKKLLSDVNGKKVRYRITEPNTSEWFRLIDIDVNDTYPQTKASVLIDGKPGGEAIDNKLTSSARISPKGTLEYTINKNIDQEKIEIKSVFLGAGKTDVYLNASKRNYPYENEWILLGALENGTTSFDVNKYYNIKDLKIVSEEAVDIYEILMTGKSYVDDPKLKAGVNELTEMLKLYLSLETSMYTQNSVNKYREKVAEAQKLLMNYSTIDDINKAKEILVNSKSLLIYKGDIDNLATLVEKMDKLIANNYTTESYERLLGAVEYAKNLISNKENAEKADVEKAAADIQNAYLLLEYSNFYYAKQKLENYIQEGEKLNKDNYTSESWKIFENTLNEVKGILKKATTDQEINKAINQYLDAFKQLSLKEGKNPEGIPSIETGDHSNYTMLITLMSLSALAIVIIVVNKRKKLNCKK